MQVLKLERRIDVLERSIGLGAGSAAWTERFVTSLTPYQFKELPLERIGSPHDGGYVLPVDLQTLTEGVVSVGVGNNNDADAELARRGLNVHEWDHTVDGPPTMHRRIVFHKTGLGIASNGEDLRDLEEIADLSFGAGSSNLLLLLDAEGAEWSQLSAASDATLARFSVMAIEFHDLGNMVFDPAARLRILERLNELFVPIAVHANNHAALWQLPGLCLPDAIEVTYVNRCVPREQGHVGNCAANLTAPCCPDLPELPLLWAP